MFKIGEIHEVNNENIKIDVVNLESYSYVTKETNVYQNLSFNIEGNLNNNCYSLYFEINDDIKELLKFKKLEKNNINEMIREYEFNINDNISINPKLNVILTKYLDNKFNIYINFIIEEEESFKEKYAGIIEFDFDLNDYIGDYNETN